MRLLHVGDLVGKPGRRAVERLLPTLIEERGVDYAVVNLENAAGGYGVTKAILEELEALPIDCFTSGNHIWDKREILPLLDARPNLLRPANYPNGNPGKGIHVGTSRSGIKVATINLEGRVYMSDLDSPFKVADRLLEELPAEVKVVLVDFHAEVTSEKQAMAFYLDGRVSAVLGTHTHVPTADERILPGGTALITDVGMTGAYGGIIGFRADKVLKKFELQTKVSLEVAKGDPRLAGALIDVDDATGRATAVERLLLPAG
ncbi:MAG: TIGR00282 family metallophosphoesterase [Acidobacteria bacterium]|nr:MAG: TIGR00282 family metallophosphoesterase [Acidobacteriota bacterium]